MKILLIVGLVVCYVYGEDSIIGYCQSEDGHWKQETHSYNEIRKQAAIRDQTANMHELKYDLDLEKVLRGLTHCDDIKDGLNYTMDHWNELYLGGVPIQTSYASCSLVREGQCGPDSKRVDIFGQKEKNNLDSFIKGPPGSKCPNGPAGGELCKGPEIPNEKTSKNDKIVFKCGYGASVKGQGSESWLDSLNHDRSVKAKVHQIANMNQLNYDPELEKMAKELISCDDLNGGSNYRGEQYVQYGEDDNLADVFSKGAKTLIRAEQFHPLQTSFAVCELSFGKKCDGVWFFFGSLNTFKTTDFKKGEPGSACEQGKTDKLLCIVPEKSTTTPGVSQNGGGSSNSSSEESNHGNVPFNMISSLFTVIFVIYLI